MQSAGRPPPGRALRPDCSVCCSHASRLGQLHRWYLVRLVRAVGCIGLGGCGLPATRSGESDRCGNGTCRTFFELRPSNHRNASQYRAAVKSAGGNGISLRGETRRSFAARVSCSGGIGRRKIIVIPASFSGFFLAYFGLSGLIASTLRPALCVSQERRRFIGQEILRGGITKPSRLSIFGKR